MRINIEKTLVEFEPENDEETAMIEALWRLIVDCAKFRSSIRSLYQWENTFHRKETLHGLLLKTDSRSPMV
ncbi:MAG: hypothetical protein JRD47_04520 [Deltaproteobacteria bacterium]|nr:hypothetical protein [Deltaproteobacteria bacterium]